MLLARCLRSIVTPIPPNANPTTPHLAGLADICKALKTSEKGLTEMVVCKELITAFHMEGDDKRAWNYELK
jgi:hypothetical protein